MSKEIVSVIKKPSTKKIPWPDSFTSELFQTFKELIPFLLIFFQKIEENGVRPNLSYEVSIVLILKPDNDTKRKEN